MIFDLLFSCVISRVKLDVLVSLLLLMVSNESIINVATDYLWALSFFRNRQSHHPNPLWCWPILADVHTKYKYWTSVLNGEGSRYNDYQRTFLSLYDICVRWFVRVVLCSTMRYALLLRICWCRAILHIHIGLCSYRSISEVCYTHLFRYRIQYTCSVYRFGSVMVYLAVAAENTGGIHIKINWIRILHIISISSRHRYIYIWHILT